VRDLPTQRLDIAEVIKHQWQSLTLKPGEKDEWDDEPATE
jgi:hypothetical protein